MEVTSFSPDAYTSLVAAGQQALQSLQSAVLFLAGCIAGLATVWGMSRWM